ncbi:antibiotic biosynthesis monooxygenase [Candidatus Magnetomonas plexicatena]|uniref:antibiotic biosynthesis monooxygenase n=1 Tax=Candidatus Magnetomonas plexicatena TaxID=2552947 RepID=UPI001C75BC1F|nr:antibiotic biosynthesis monooxygenase [Nitrospirales bacterium LBB_01]
MIVTAVTVYVKVEHIKDFIEATRKNHEASVKEPGNMRFDVLQCKDEPGRFLLYEAYESEAASKAHKDTSHYLLWRETVEPWMTRPRQGVAHSVVYPTERSMW